MQLVETKYNPAMEFIELIDFVSSCKTGKETEGEPSQLSKTNGTRRREICNSSISSLDVRVSGDPELDSSMEIVS